MPLRLLWSMCERMPLDKRSLEPVLKENFPKEFETNMAAFKKGMKLVGH